MSKGWSYCNDKSMPQKVLHGIGIPEDKHISLVVLFFKMKDTQCSVGRKMVRNY